ncbi:hypothetical protein KI387_043317, partial [Taxus chinensis]
MWVRDSNGIGHNALITSRTNEKLLLEKQSRVHCVKDDDPKAQILYEDEPM